MYPRLSMFFIFLVAAFIANGQSSVLSTGPWGKIAVEKEGVYKINFDLLKKMGLDPGQIDPHKIRIFGNEGGMLPQANAAMRPNDLTEVAIHVEGEADGKFDKKDFILFYANGPYKATFDAQKKIFKFENNLYSTKNFYFVTIGQTDGLRVAQADNIPSAGAVVETFNDYFYHETDETNILSSGREWYGEKFDLTTEHAFDVKVEGVQPGSEVKLVSDVVAQTAASTTFRVSINGILAGEHSVNAVPSGTYSVKGVDRRDTFLLAESVIGAAAQARFNVSYQYVKTAGVSFGYLDFFLINFERQLALYGDQTIFTSASSVANPVSTFRIQGLSAGQYVWDVTDQRNIKSFVPDFSGGVASITTETTALKKFVAFSAKMPAPEFVTKVPNQDLHGAASPNLIVVTHPDFYSEALRLGSHRESHSGWSTLVATTEQIYNEFSSGRADVTAIRDFIRHLYLKSPGTVKAVLVFGRGSYDYKDRKPNNTNFVPIYQSRNSLSPLSTYGSDDYLAFMEASEGEWQESPAKHHTLDLGVGRIPVKNVAEAKNVVDKIIEYETSSDALGYWRKKIVFVADDGSTSDGFTAEHQRQANDLATYIEQTQPAFDTKKLFLGAYQKELRVSEEIAPKMNEDVVRAFEDGSLIINFTGHGNELKWCDEGVFSNRTIGELRNKLYPFLVTATCEFGRHDDVLTTSGAELALIRANAGAIGLVSTSRPVNSITNFDLNQAFYEALFNREGDGYNTIGEVFRQTKNNSTSGVSNRNFSLLGDPSMTLAMPRDMVKITSIKSSTGSDTLKALSTVIVTGQIEDASGLKRDNFNGTVEVRLFDKQVEFQTIGRNNPAFVFRQWNNVLFRGQATIKDGEFSLDFMLPKNMAYAIAQGKLGLYAYDKAGRDANGSTATFKVGGTESVVLAENNAPDVQLFVGDTTFVNGGIASPDTYIVARITDDRGINMSGYGIGNTMTATLDDGAQTYQLNDYFIADKDNPARGLVKYPIYGLTPGNHTLTFQVWDVFNNSAVASVAFVVTGEGIRIESLGNYPNPFVDKTTFFFTHNRSGDDLEAQLFIYSSAGGLLHAVDVPISQSEYKVELMELNTVNGEKKLPAGLYLARLVVRSLSNGSKNEQVTKLIVVD